MTTEIMENTQTNSRKSEGAIAVLDRVEKAPYTELRRRAREFAEERGLTETEIECILLLGDNGHACNCSNSDLDVRSYSRDDVYSKTEGMRGAEVSQIAQALGVADSTASLAGTRLWRDDLAVKLRGYNCRRMADNLKKVELTLTPRGAALYVVADDLINSGKKRMKGGSE
jgi:hypothetical protein